MVDSFLWDGVGIPHLDYCNDDKRSRLRLLVKQPQIINLFFTRFLINLNSLFEFIELELSL